MNEDTVDGSVESDILSTLDAINENLVTANRITYATGIQTAKIEATRWVILFVLALGLGYLLATEYGYE